MSYIDRDVIRQGIFLKRAEMPKDEYGAVSGNIYEWCPLVDIDAVPIRHGEWIRKTDTRFGPKLNDIIICSECKIAFSTEDMLRRSYCPNCGAKMDEVSE